MKRQQYKNLGYELLSGEWGRQTEKSRYDILAGCTTKDFPLFLQAAMLDTLIKIHQELMQMNKQSLKKAKGSKQKKRQKKGKAK